ncbi:hypothetical protein AGMMS50289_23530 [Betaproteobacteria bacterium]|nr:hypothetical protein AGMMS50289_23530 [Betaproteobacteria bacterium]
MLDFLEAFGDDFWHFWLTLLLAFLLGLGLKLLDRAGSSLGEGWQAGPDRGSEAWLPVPFRAARREMQTGGAGVQLKSFLSGIFKSHEPESPTQADAPRPAQRPQQPPKRLLSWPLRVGAGALFLMFAYVTGWMALEGDRAWYGGVLPALLFGRYAQKGAVGDQFFSYVWKAFLVVVFVDVVLHEVLQ